MLWKFFSLITDLHIPASVFNWWVGGFGNQSWSPIIIPWDFFLVLFSDLVRLLCGVLLFSILKRTVFLWHNFLKSVQFPVTNPWIFFSLLPYWSKSISWWASKENRRIHSIGFERVLLPCVKIFAGKLLEAWVRLYYKKLSNTAQFLCCDKQTITKLKECFSWKGSQTLLSLAFSFCRQGNWDSDSFNEWA